MKLIKFYTQTCTPCKVMKPIIDKLVQNHPELEYQEVDWSKIPVDTKVYVRDSENEQWKPRYFAKYDEYTDSVMTYENGATSWSGLSDFLNIWSYVKLAED